MNIDLRGKCALITGSTSGIGLGMAKVFAAAGCNLVLHGIEPEERIKAIAKEVAQTFGVNVLGVSADLTQLDSVSRLIASATSEFAAIDILINNAGVQFVSPIENFPPEKWRQLLELHLVVPFQLAQKTLPEMRRRGWGRIINIASVHGLIASKNKSAYVAAKHGVIGFTKAVALETANSGVTCNAICPGWVRTPLVEAQIQQKSEQEKISFTQALELLLGEKQPLTSFITVEQLAELALFMCSSASTAMTGSIVTMDGGWTAQ